MTDVLTGGLSSEILKEMRQAILAWDFTPSYVIMSKSNWDVIRLLGDTPIPRREFAVRRLFHRRRYGIAINPYKPNQSTRLLVRKR